MIRHLSLKVLCVLAGALGTTFAQPLPAQTSDAVRQQRIEEQIAVLNRAKAARTPAERKIESALLFAIEKQQNTPLSKRLPRLRSEVASDSNGRVLVHVRGNISANLTARIRRSNGVVGRAFPRQGLLRARLPLGQLKAIAAQPEVRFIRRAFPPRPRGATAAQFQKVLSAYGSRLAPAQSGDAPEGVSIPEAIASPTSTPPARRVPRTTSTGAIVTEGVTTHQAREVHEQFGATGRGVKIGVISDSVDFLEESQMAGELPAVTVLPGQSGVPATGEGTAMLEIVHDMAPDAELFFATSTDSQAQFAQNIRALRQAGCDIIVDDIELLDESPFQPNPIAVAIRDVTRDDALYFSAVGNTGNFNDGTSGVWEGNFRGVTTDKVGLIHNWGRGIVNRLRDPGGPLCTLKWSDPIGKSNNDYDLFLVDSDGQIVGTSNDDQTGTQDPYEIVYESYGDAVYVARYSGQNRYLRLTSYGSPLEQSTSGGAGDHNTIPECISVAAVDAFTSFPGPFVGGARNPVEPYSTDGPRRLFFDENGNALGALVAPGGRLVTKPDMAAADNVRVATLGFHPSFRGTSAAAPHAAACAALIKSFNPSLGMAQIRGLLVRSALDIEQPGLDRDSGAGIVMPLRTLQMLQREDQTRPVVTITTPTYNQAISRLTRIAGTVQDTGSGLERLELFLQRDRDNRYWSGRNWGITPIVLRPVVTGSTFSLSENLPNDLNLLAGNYLIYVAAVDRAGNRVVVSSRVRVTDTVSPALTIEAVDRDTRGGRILRIRGTLVDEPRGSGPDRVVLFLRRASDGRYWNGTAWVTTQAALETELFGSSNSRAWQRTANWPTTPPTTASALFYVTAVGYDVAGNRASATKSVILQGAPPAPTPTPAT
jgi:hypothetical protein